jgi:hypothetical protein
MKKISLVSMSVIVMFVLLFIVNVQGFDRPSRPMPPYWSQTALAHGWFDRVIEPKGCLHLTFDITPEDLQKNSQARLYYDVVGNGSIEAVWLTPNGLSEYENTSEDKKFEYIDNVIRAYPQDVLYLRGGNVRTMPMPFKTGSGRYAIVFRNTNTWPVTISFAITFF